MNQDRFHAELKLVTDQPSTSIHRDVYGHFAEHLGRGIYEGIWVGEGSLIPNVRGIRSDVVAALKRLDIPVLRWPGGCFADEYHWQDGIGPREQRRAMFNSHWGGVTESNHFGTHEFMDLCEQVGARAYVCGNVGSGTVQEMMQWVEYISSDADSPMANLRRNNGREAPWSLAYFGVGNESWGCGGNMRPEFYADNYRRYATFVKNYTPRRIERIACGANADDYEWTRVLMQQASRQMEGLSLHWYTLPTKNWTSKGSATVFGEEEWHSTLVQALRMDPLIVEHSAIMDQYDPDKRVGLAVDEWGTWYDAEPGTNPGFLQQQNTLRDALVGAVTLNVFNDHCDRVRMANIAQTVNVLQAMILTEQGEILLTPSYHVFELYKVHQGATRVPLQLDAPPYLLGNAHLPALHASASRATSGLVHVSIANLDPHREAALMLSDAPGRVTGRVLSGSAMTAHNTFAEPECVRPVPLAGCEQRAGATFVTLPSKSVVVLEIETETEIDSA